MSCPETLDSATAPALESSLLAACLFGVSQPTASRRWDLLRDPIADALDHLVPTVRQVVGHGGSVLVDGFLAPTWNWKHVRGMFSDKHGEAGCLKAMINTYEDVPDLIVSLL